MNKTRKPYTPRPTAKISRVTVDYQGWYTLTLHTHGKPDREVRSRDEDDVIHIAAALKVSKVTVATGMVYSDDVIEQKLDALGVKLGERDS